MIAIIRIRGQVKVVKEVKETLERLRLRKKYSCVIIREKPELVGMIRRVQNFVAYGAIDKETFIELVRKRGKALKKGSKIDAEKIVAEFLGSKTEKSIEEFGIKPFFRLHPPRGGINSKIHFPKGVLGNNKEKVNELIRKML